MNTVIMENSYFPLNTETTERRDDNKGEIMDPPRHFDVSKMGESPFKRQKQLRRFRVLLDSTYRPQSYQDPSKYEINLPEPIYGIEKIQLMRAFIPNSIYTINSNTNILEVTVNAVNYSISLTQGNYTNDGLATELETRLNSAGVGTGWVVTHDNTSGILTFDTTGVAGSVVTSFSVRASEMLNLAPILGFGRTDVSGLTLSSPHPMNTSQPMNLLLNLAQGSDRFDSMIIPTSTRSARCFAYIPLGMGTGHAVSESAATLSGSNILVAGGGFTAGYGYYYISKDTTTAYYDFYEGSRGSLSKLTVNFDQLLPDGTLVTPDFNNANHIIELEILAQVDKISAIM